MCHDSKCNYVFRFWRTWFMGVGGGAWNVGNLIDICYLIFLGCVWYLKFFWGVWYQIFKPNIYMIFANTWYLIFDWGGGGGLISDIWLLGGLISDMWSRSTPPPPPLIKLVNCEILVQHNWMSRHHRQYISSECRHDTLC